ncbi:hypothetical protein SAMN04487948_12842 [Halogranum amylolyticum]|uniref:Uncharacterized protein n=1 Tax=Halogranum amylolyticum TaxID=660520 RepID=A0A1H8WER8_9EURY|nr:hypothetical protein [Halogranum amylolyticum]SEP26160.1 hypothetical protein SAMN04487948_12842 [Halogranum amylolyticum]
MQLSDGSRRDDESTVDADSSVRAMQDAALERALLSSTDRSDYVAFAGALERARLDGDLSLSGVTVLACLVGLRLGQRETTLLDFASGDRPTDDLLVEGAVVASERFELSSMEAASLANRSVEDFETELERRDRIE